MRLLCMPGTSSSDPQERDPGVERGSPHGRGMPKYRKGDRRVGGTQTRLETPLPPADIVPGPELVSYRLIDTHMLKAQGDMQTDTGRIRQGDAGVAIVESL